MILVTAFASVAVTFSIFEYLQHLGSGWRRRKNGGLEVLARLQYLGLLLGLLTLALICLLTLALGARSRLLLLACC